MYSGCAVNWYSQLKWKVNKDTHLTPEEAQLVCNNYKLEE